MERRFTPAILLVLMAIQAWGIGYFVFFAPQSQPVTGSAAIREAVRQELVAYNDSQVDGSNSFIDRDEERLIIRQIVRDELTAFFSSDQKTDISSVSQPPQQEKNFTAENVKAVEEDYANDPETAEAADAAFTDSRVIIDTAMAEGVWTIKNSTDIMNYAFMMPPGQRKKLRDELFRAAARNDFVIQGALPDI